MFKTLLCIPPDYDYNFPPLGTPVLAGFLKNKGFETGQVDLNVKYRNFLIKHISGTEDDEVKKFILKDTLRKFFREKLRGRYYSDFLPGDTDGFFPYLPYENNSNSSFYFTERLLSSQYLWQYLEDAAENTFLQFFSGEKIVDFLDKERINLLGISIISPSQVIAALTLGLLVKKYLPHIHISIGGQWPTLYRKALLQRKKFFRCFDSIVVYEGETPLYNLILKLKNKGRLTLIPNVYLKNDRINPAEKYSEEDLNLLPCPDFADLSLKDYDGFNDLGVIALTYETSRGCYWGRCAYCVDLPLPKPSYRRKQPELVARDMQQLKRRYAPGHLMLSDPGVSPRQMKEISNRLIKEKVEMGWWCMARLDSGFNYELFCTAKRAGLRQINFGFESVSDHLCELLHKGNKKECSLRIIKECRQSGIKVDLQTMLGLPQEKFADGLETINFLVSNKKYIDNVTFNVYYLTPANYVYQNPQKYAIEYEADPELPFRFFIPFKNPQGISRNEAYLLQQLYWAKSEEDDARKDFYREEKFSLAENVFYGQLEFSLNRDLIDMPCLYQNSNKNRFFFSKPQKAILEYLRQGKSLGEIFDLMEEKYPGLNNRAEVSAFIGVALGKGFLTKNKLPN